MSFKRSELIEVAQAWVESTTFAGVPLGLAVSEALQRGRQLRDRVAAGELLSIDLTGVGDVVHAACRSMWDDCPLAPERVLAEASAMWGALRDSDWPDDELEERKSVMSTLSFLAWRCARILDNSRDATAWELEYRREFRTSLDWEISEAGLGSDHVLGDPASDTIAAGAERVFQALLHLQERAETDPQLVAQRAIRLYRGLLSSRNGPFEPDLQQYFLGESARVAATVLRGVAPDEAGRWLDSAEKHFRAGVNPAPQLARVLFIRLTLLYAMTRCDLVVEKAPQLDSVFSTLGMDEDRVKCRIMWAGSLKLIGRCQEALSVLEPVRQARSNIRPALFGWVLLQAGDIHQMCGDQERALEDLLEAARLLREGRQLTGLADVYSMVSCIYRANGRLDEAVTLLETGRQDHARLGMKWPEAYHRILIAETYLAMGRPREAEIEIRAALPMLEEQGMLADAVIAVNLLREAVRQRKLQPVDIRDSFKPKA